MYATFKGTRVRIIEDRGDGRYIILNRYDMYQAVSAWQLQFEEVK